jgi:hypothetical protein
MIQVWCIIVDVAACEYRVQQFSFNKTTSESGYYSRWKDINIAQHLTG